MVPGNENLGNRQSGIEHPGVLDAFAHDTREDKLVLAMYESRPWAGDDTQLFQLQEKLNAYLSFILDGEMRESFPHLCDKPVEIQLRSQSEPDPRSLHFLSTAKQQLALQDIALEIIVVSDEGSCGSGSCGCS